MRVKKKLSKTARFFKRITCVLLAVSITVVIFFELTVRDRIELAMIAQIKTLAHDAINDAVSDYLKDNKSVCDELVRVNSDGINQIKSITENTYNVNILKTELNMGIQEYIEKKMSSDKLYVKLGNFSGLTLLSDFGPYVRFNIESTPTVSCAILSKFESTGVNQSIHHIELEVDVDIYVGNPIRIESVSFTDKYEISQTVIMGIVPNTYGSITRY